MGPRYVAFRSWYEVRRRSGLLKRSFPVNPSPKSYWDLQTWRSKRPAFFFKNRDTISFPKELRPTLQQKVETFKAGKLAYFNAEVFEIGRDYDWLQNPATGHQYPKDQHWTEVEDFSAAAGDIKYTWEKSRFSFLYPLIRYDYHSGEDQAEEVFAEIDSWIAANGINQGPNYKCSQEISLRILNWTFALYYYADHSSLTEARWQRIQHAIYWQIKHVYSNIHFSRISVRNNHAITETLLLYLAGHLFPFFPEAKTWKRRGKAWFEEEIAYQVYEDGTYLQFSHNYHRVVVQLMSWAFFLAKVWGDTFQETTYSRAQASLRFLQLSQAGQDGELPNYGANDGALFFPWNDCNYRDYRPQLNALAYALEGRHAYPEGPWREDVAWFTGGQASEGRQAPEADLGAFSFPVGGFYVLRTPKTSLHLRCGKFRDRPAQADNLHLDLWVNGQNVFRDNGSYRYNTDLKWLLYFNGTKSHNTVSLGDQHQMEKGPRFIWLHWSEAKTAAWRETEEYWEFSGVLKAFGQLGSDILHHRTVRQFKEEQRWEVIDQMDHQTNLPMHQHWQPGPAFAKLGGTLQAVDGDGNILEAIAEEGYYSPLYGVKEPFTSLRYTTHNKTIKTTIQLS